MSDTPIGDRPPMRPAPHRVPDRRPEGPRRVTGGLKLRRGEPPAPVSEAARRWLRLIESALPVTALTEGIRYALTGQVAKMIVAPGVIRATVQGRDPRPYQTTLALRQLADTEWTEMIEAMSGEVVYVAKLLAGDLPGTLPDLFRRRGLEIVPFDRSALTIRCNCSEPKPCKHAAALGYVVMERLDDEPLMVLTLRGLAHDRLLDRLQQARAMQQRGVASAHPDPLIPETTVEPPLLEASLENYWREGPEVSDLIHRPQAEYAPHSLLRRLGPSPLDGKFPLSGLLASIYDTVAAAMVRLRERAEE